MGKIETVGNPPTGARETNKKAHPRMRSRIFY